MLTLNLAYHPGSLRRGGHYLWLLYMAWVAWYWLGLLGLGLVCVASTRMLRSLWQAPAYQVTLVFAELKQAWVMPWAIWVDTTSGGHWLCRDELPSGQWALLLRSLRLYLPRQALGLSISN